MIQYKRMVGGPTLNQANDVSTYAHYRGEIFRTVIEFQRERGPGFSLRIEGSVIVRFEKKDGETVEQRIECGTEQEAERLARAMYAAAEPPVDINKVRQATRERTRQCRARKAKS